MVGKFFLIKSSPSIIASYPSGRQDELMQPEESANPCRSGGCGGCGGGRCGGWGGGGWGGGGWGGGWGGGGWGGGCCGGRRRLGHRHHHYG
ncbi:hypothetical protein FQR65_LT03170 [Abscondita terminalis]|nr:hypothetical protein FQR65_LT03170 [Abscondita terminalis]